MDSGAVASLWWVLARIRAPEKENQAARNLAPTLWVRASARARFLFAFSRAGPLWLVGEAFCFGWSLRRIDWRSADRRGNRRGILGPLASRHQLERRSHAQRRARTDSNRPL